jgi:hypothetical protein
MKRLAFALILLALLIPLGATAAPDVYTIILSNSDTGQRWWEADYDRTLSAGVGWTDGDRAGYKCAYGFLLRNGQVVGRFTFTRIPEAEGYARVNDKYMVEGARHWATGALSSRRNPVLQSECPAPTETYEPFAGNELPTIQFRQGTTVLETRSYPLVDAGEGVTFQQTFKDSKNVTVVAYEDGLPTIVIYYRSFGSVTLSSDLP